MRKRISSFLLASILCLTLLDVHIGSTVVHASEVENQEKKVAPLGVSVEGQDVSGMTESEVDDVINRYIDRYDDINITLTASGEKFETKAGELALKAYNDVTESIISYGETGNIIERFIAKSDIESGKGRDFSLILTSDDKKTSEFLEENAKQLDSAPVDNSLVRENGGFRIIEGKPGIVVDYDESAKLIAEFIETKWNGNEAELELAVKKEEPRGSKEELSQVKDVLGSCSTDFSSSSAARAGNVKNGTSKLDGSLIFPGEEFSVSTNLESRNAENGYLPAPSYENGTTVDTYGGGVCQISTTLYNAVIRAELEVVERSPHSMVVSYVKPSMDAAISEGSKDFVFKNNKEYPIYIEGYTASGQLYFNIFGKEDRPSNRTVEYESEVISENPPVPAEKFVANEGLPAGTISREQSAHIGYSAQLWKIVKENGVEVSREVFNTSKYRPSPAIFNVGTAGDSGAIGAAIATQDRGAIDAAVAGGGAPSEPAQEEEQQEENKESEKKKKKKKKEKEEKKEEKEEKQPEEAPSESEPPSDEENSSEGE